MDSFLPPDFPDLTGAACAGETRLADAAYAGGAGAEQMRRVCLSCPVREPCAEWAASHEQHGVWGGLGPHGRTRARRTAC